MLAAQTIQVEGVAKSLKILRSLDKQLASEVTKQLRASVKPVINQAKQNVPGQALSKWGPWTTGNGRDLAFNSKTARAGIRTVQKTTSKRAKRGGYRPIAILELQNRTAAGSVFELAGAANPNSVFNQNIERKHGAPKRVLFKAWDDRGEQVDQDVEAAVRRIEAEINRKLSAP